jgi:hypothetical protein
MLRHPSCVTQLLYIEELQSEPQLTLSSPSALCSLLSGMWATEVNVLLLPPSLSLFFHLPKVGFQS